MQRMSVASRGEFGCISYEFYIGLSDPNTLLLFQEWESVEALQDHFDTPHMEEFMKVLPDVLDGEVATRRYEVRNPGDIPGAADDEGYADKEGGRSLRSEGKDKPVKPEHRPKIVH